MKAMGAIPGGFEASADNVLMIGGHDARALVELQLNGTQENHDRVRMLRDERRRLAA